METAHLQDEKKEVVVIETKPQFYSNYIVKSVEYGHFETSQTIDVTDFLWKAALADLFWVVQIPAGDENRVKLLGRDPAVGLLKSIKITYTNESHIFIEQHIAFVLRATQMLLMKPLDRFLQIGYGKNDTYLDVTFAALQYGLSNNKVCIPPSDEARANGFGDPCPNVLKDIVWINETGEKTVFDHNTQAEIRVSNYNHLVESLAFLHFCHLSLRLNHGSLYDEFPEQCMAVAYIHPSAKVLELGSNIGRNTLIIAASLHNPSTNLVTLECDPKSFTLLLENRELNKEFYGKNNTAFRAENAALSNIPLMQKDWNTLPIPTDGTIASGYEKVQTITFGELEAKYNIQFDTLVADCEGALYHIFKQDAENVLRNIKTIVMENDYFVLEQKQFVDQTMKNMGFERIFSQYGGWGPCANFFYEVWQR